MTVRFKSPNCSNVGGSRLSALQSHFVATMVAKLAIGHDFDQPKLIAGSRALVRSFSAIFPGEPAARMNAARCCGGTACWCA